MRTFSITKQFLGNNQKKTSNNLKAELKDLNCKIFLFVGNLFIY